MENSYLEIIKSKKQIEVANIKKCNEFTNKYGLMLSDAQIESLMEKRIDILKNTGRIEFRNGIIDKIIKEFCDSPYINQENYVLILCGLLDIFYEYKNETMDLVTDDELIKFMKKSFNGICKGDIEYLSGTVMYKMKQRVLNGELIDYIEIGEDYE